MRKKCLISFVIFLIFIFECITVNATDVELLNDE